MMKPAVEKLDRDTPDEEGRPRPTPKMVMNEKAGKEEPVWSAKMLFDLENMSDADKKLLDDLKAECKAIAKIHWHGKAAKFVEKKALRPFKDGDDMDWEGAEGKHIADSNTKYVPKFYLRDKTEVDGKDSGAVDEVFYSGAICRAMVSPAVYDLPENSGVKLYLQAIQKVSDGERITGGKSDFTSDFDDLPAEESEDIPF